MTYKLFLPPFSVPCFCRSFSLRVDQWASTGEVEFCASYTGPRKEGAGMTIVQIHLLSGFVAVPAR